MMSRLNSEAESFGSFHITTQPLDRGIRAGKEGAVKGRSLGWDTGYGPRDWVVNLKKGPPVWCT
jgi:hypothetical protein